MGGEGNIIQMIPYANLLWGTEIDAVSERVSAAGSMPQIAGSRIVFVARIAIQKHKPIEPGLIPFTDRYIK